MKQRRTTLRTVAVLLLLFLCGTFLLCSCSYSRSVMGASLNDDGELILTYSDGTTENLGLVKGADGEDGAPGIRGEAGKKGKDGKDGKDGEKGDPGEDGENGTDGVLTIVPDSDTVALACAKGLRSAVRILCQFSSGASAGSGVIYRLDPTTGDALIITNYHVVYNSGKISNNISLYLYGAEYKNFAIEAQYVGGSMVYDIAVLSVTGSDVLKQSAAAAVTVSDSDEVRVGSEAIAIGNPKNLGIAASFGIVSVVSEQISMIASDNRTQVKMRVMRIDTAVNAGNSGGGLFNHAGELIGIVNAKIMSGDVENIGYAIPSNLAIAVAENIIDHCLGKTTKTAMRATLGVTFTPTESYAEYDATTGEIHIVEKVGIQTVSAGSAADGKLQEGDTIVSITLNGQTYPVTRGHHLTDRILDIRAGDTVTFTVLRDGAEQTVTVTITADNMVSY